MKKHTRIITEYRNYVLPMNFPVLHLTGDYWKISDVKSDRLHFHNCLEIGVCHSHSGILDIMGNEIPFKEGDVTCIPKNLPHTTCSTKGGESVWSYLFVDIEGLFSKHFKDFSTDLDTALLLIKNLDHLMNRETYPKVHFLITCILEELESKKMNYHTSVKGLLLSLCIEFLRIHDNIISSKQTELNSENILALSPAIDFIQKNYMNHFTIEYLANLCHLSTTHFRRIFHSIMNTSPLDYLNQTRIYQSCVLLRSTEDPILSISEQVGFRTISSFNRYFSKIIGTTPTKWRANIGQNNSNKEKPVIFEYNGWMLPPEQ